MKVSNKNNKYIYKVVAVYGSPRRGGNTDLLMNCFLEGLSKYKEDNPGWKKTVKLEKIFVNELKISPCRECRHCSIKGECIVDDQMQQIYPKMESCNLLAIASPVFFTTVSGYLKAFIDRFQKYWALKYELDKKTIKISDRKGILFSCAGSKPVNIFDCTKKVVRSLFDVLYISYFADFCFNSIDFKGDVEKNPDIMDMVHNFGKNGNFIKEG